MSTLMYIYGWWNVVGRSVEFSYVYWHRSVGDGGTRPPPTFQRGGQHKNCPPPHFSAQINCEAYNLIHHSSLLKAATQD